MKITFLAPHIKIAGGIRAFLTYAHLLAKRGHQVTVVVPMSVGWKRLAGNLFRRRPVWFKDFKARICWIESYAESNIPDGDIVVATAWQTAEPAASYGSSKGKKFYLIQHYESLYHGNHESADASYRLPLHKIVISTWLKDMMRDKFQLSSELIVTPVDTALFHEVPGLRASKPVRILMLDHTAAWKGVAKGFEAHSRIKKELPDGAVELVLFGVRKRTDNIPADHYFFNPPQEKLASLYSSAHIYVCPSEYEGLGMPSMEAMACGTALVTFDTGGSRDYAFAGRTAFVAEHGNAADLADKLKLAATDAVERERIARAGKEFIISNFSWERATSRMEEIFQHVP